MNDEKKGDKLVLHFLSSLPTSPCLYHHFYSSRKMVWNQKWDANSCVYMDVLKDRICVANMWFYTFYNELTCNWVPNTSGMTTSTVCYIQFKVSVQEPCGLMVSCVYSGTHCLNMSQLSDPWIIISPSIESD